MKFQERSAGKAQESRPRRRGTAGLSMARLARISTSLATALAVCVLLPGAALAGSPLLSGYAGPGSGEQAVLGGGVVGGSSGGGGGNSGGGASGATANQSLAATPSANAPSADTGSASGGSSSRSGSALSSRPHRKKSSSHTSSSKKPSTGSTSSSTSTTTTTRTGAPAVTAYRNSSGQVGSFPLSAGGVVIALLALIAIVLAALGLRMVGRDGDDDGPPISQVAVR
jgi:hypothetical protein